jgi:hypothetical protein
MQGLLSEMDLAGVILRLYGTGTPVVIRFDCQRQQKNLLAKNFLH